MVKRIGSILCALFLFWGFFLPSAEASIQDPLHVVVPIPPLEFLARSIGGEFVAVHTLLPPGRDPHTYAPLPGQLREMGEASCFFYLGLPLEKNVLEALKSSEQLHMVSLQPGLSLRTMQGGHSHGDEAVHEHEQEGHTEQDHRAKPSSPEKEDFANLQGYDPHVWMAPLNMAIMANTMADTLQELDPAHAKEYAANAQTLTDQLEVLHGYLQSILAPVKGRILLVYHPAYGYFCDAYGLRQMAIEREGKPPRGQDLTALIQTAREEKIRAIFTQPQFDQRTARTIASAIGARVLSFEPFPQDYITYLQTMGAILRAELETP